MLNKNEMLNLNWFGGVKRVTREDMDVTINKVKKGYTFIFRNSVYKKFGKVATDGKYRLEIAVLGSLLCFRCTNSGKVITDRVNNKVNTGYIKFEYCDEKRNGAKEYNDMLAEINDFIGDHEIMYHKDFDIYYIQK